MPELPEVETVVTALNRCIPGKTVAAAVSLGKMRLPFSAPDISRSLRNRVVSGVRRRAKYILIDFADSTEPATTHAGKGGKASRSTGENPAYPALLAHLGMTGFFHNAPRDEPLLKHDRAALQFTDGSDLRYSDARRFGFISLVSVEGPGAWPLELAGIGMEPLSPACNARAFHALASGRKAPVKVFIMDQAVVAGVGNIYASEALFMARIDPRRPAGTVTEAEWRSLAAAIKKVLRSAIRKGGSTIRNYRSVDGGEGSFQRTLLVYGKEKTACPQCGRAVESIRLGGRSTFFCADCQK